MNPCTDKHTLVLAGIPELLPWIIFCVCLLLCASLRLLHLSCILSKNLFLEFLLTSLVIQHCLWVLWLLQPSPLLKTKNNWFASMHLCAFVAMPHPTFWRWTRWDYFCKLYVFKFQPACCGLKYTQRRAPASWYIVAFISNVAMYLLLSIICNEREPINSVGFWTLKLQCPSSGSILRNHTHFTFVDWATKWWVSLVQLRTRFTYRGLWYTKVCKIEFRCLIWLPCACNTSAYI